MDNRLNVRKNISYLSIILMGIIIMLYFIGYITNPFISTLLIIIIDGIDILRYYKRGEKLRSYLLYPYLL